MDMQLVNNMRQHKDNLRRLSPMRRYAVFAEGAGMGFLLCAIGIGMPILVMPAMICMFISSATKRAWLRARHGLVEAEAAFILDYAVNSPYANGMAENVDHVMKRIGPTFHSAIVACYWRPAFVFVASTMPLTLPVLMIIIIGLLMEVTYLEKLVKSLEKLSRQIVPQTNGKDANTVTLAA